MCYDTHVPLYRGYRVCACVCMLGHACAYVCTGVTACVSARTPCRGCTCVCVQGLEREGACMRVRMLGHACACVCTGVTVYVHR